MESNVSDTKLQNLELAPRQYENNKIPKRIQDSRIGNELLVYFSGGVMYFFTHGCMTLHVSCHRVTNCDRNVSWISLESACLQDGVAMLLLLNVVKCCYCKVSLYFALNERIATDFKYQFFKYSKSKYKCNDNIILKYPTVVDDR